MKKLNHKKLVLAKTTVAMLTSTDLMAIAGGAVPETKSSCILSQASACHNAC